MMKIVIFAVLAIIACCFAWLVTMSSQKKYPRIFRVKRGEVESYDCATLSQVTSFLDACRLVSGSPEWEAALAGNPILIDGAMMQFIPVTDASIAAHFSPTLPSEGGVLLKAPASVWLHELVDLLEHSHAPVWIIGPERSGKSLLADAIIDACVAQKFRPEVLEFKFLPDAIPDEAYVVAFGQNRINCAEQLSALFYGEVTPDELLRMPQWRVCFRAGCAADGTAGRRGYVDVKSILAPWKPEEAEG